MSEANTNPIDRIEIAVPDDTVVIKELVIDDAQAYFDLIEYDRIHLSQLGHQTASKYKNVDAVLNSIENPQPNKYRFGIWDGDTMVGSNNLTLFEDGRAETGSWVGAEHIGKNYAARARRLLLQFAFSNLGISEVFSDIAVGNEASRRSVEKSGYTFDHEAGGRLFYVLKKEDYGG